MSVSKYSTDVSCLKKLRGIYYAKRFEMSAFEVSQIRLTEPVRLEQAYFSNEIRH